MAPSLDASTLDRWLLALAGLKRLNLTQHVTEVLSDESFLPAELIETADLPTHVGQALAQAVGRQMHRRLGWPEAKGGDGGQHRRIVVLAVKPPGGPEGVEKPVAPVQAKIGHDEHHGGGPQHP